MIASARMKGTTLAVQVVFHHRSAIASMIRSQPANFSRSHRSWPPRSTSARLVRQRCGFELLRAASAFHERCRACPPSRAGRTRPARRRSAIRPPRSAPGMAPPPEYGQLLSISPLSFVHVPRRWIPSGLGGRPGAGPYVPRMAFLLILPTLVRASSSTNPDLVGHRVSGCGRLDRFLWPARDRRPWPSAPARTTIASGRSPPVVLHPDHRHLATTSPGAGR